ncbi:DUF2474 domain-containing protein [Sphingomonas sp. H39-1-10]|nr:MULTISPECIES: DUF2474 domain-containing protein [Sphingomonadaceae]MDF0490127.1 DUF2474 domain-containing protein [Sphingomonas pollutisoli]PJG45453.1 DUF2474 domain-containing protein [Sphingobium sp. LB126]
MRSASHSRRLWLGRFGWLVLIWAASVLALGVVAMAFRWLMGLAGLTTG